MQSNFNMKNEILKDVNQKGKDNGWKERKLKSLMLADSYKRLGYKKYYRVLDCSTFLEFKVTTAERLKLTNANFCKVRLCPMCSWRRSLKIFGQVSKVMDYVETHNEYKYIFLTLTVRNCKGDELKSTLDLMTQAFNRLNQRKSFKRAVKGYFRSLEVTFNKAERTYHPHFHLILAVNKSYFTDPKLYFSQNDWTELWKSCLRIDYTPVVDVRKVRQKAEKSYSNAVAEVAKYAVKAEDYLIKDEFGNVEISLTDEVVQVLDRALHGKRLTSFGFKFKEVHKLLSLDDAEDGDLVQTDGDDLREDLTDMILRYQWGIGIKNYRLVAVSSEPVAKK